MWRRFASRAGRVARFPATSLVVLLSLTGLRPESNLVETLRGRERIEAELERAETRGYYEGLLDTSALAERRGRPDGPAEVIAPPPGWKPFIDSGLVAPEPTYLRWRLLPGREVAWNGKLLRTNRLGYRSPEIADPKPAGTFRIVVFGSSNTMGQGVEDGEIYLRLLERWLNEMSGPARRVEVVNAAVSADSPTRRLLRMRLEADRLDPDLMLCDATILDFSLEVEHLSAVVREGLPLPFPFVSEALRRSGVSAADPPEVFSRKLWREFDLLIGGAYAGWAGEARRLGVPMEVVLLPRADRKADNPGLTEKLLGFARREGLDMLNLSGAFDGLRIDQFRVAPWEMHPSPIGQRVLFEALRDEILRRGGLPGLPVSQGRGGAELGTVRAGVGSSR